MPRKTVDKIEPIRYNFVLLTVNDDERKAVEKAFQLEKKKLIGGFLNGIT